MFVGGTFSGQDEVGGGLGAGQRPAVGRATAGEHGGIVAVGVECGVDQIGDGAESGLA